MKHPKASIRAQIITVLLISYFFVDFSNTYAQVNEMQPVGSNGGTYFRDEADVKEIIIRSGHWIDGIQLVDKNGSKKPNRGGTGGGVKYFRLQAGEYIREITGSATGGFGPYVSQIQIHTNKRSSPLYGKLRGIKAISFKIPQGKKFAGFSGRSGKYLHAIGVLYKSDAIPPAPVLVQPYNQAVLDNGCATQSNELSWAFNWNHVQGASRYQLYVKNSSSQNPFINSYVSANTYNYYNANSHIPTNMLAGWLWYVRAEVNGVWGAWSAPQVFTVEALNADCKIINHSAQIRIQEPAIAARGFVVVEAEKSFVSGNVVDKDGTAIVRINGVLAQLDNYGNFNASVPLNIGENVITVTAIDKKRETTSKTFRVVRNETAVKATKRLALVIGNADYVFGGSLINPINDANSIYTALSNLGFTVIKHTDCNQRTMKEAIDDFGEKLKNYDVGLFFYAGHGVQVNGNNYLIPTNAKLRNENDAEYDCVRASRVLAKMENAGAKTNIVIMDACRDNPFERSWSRSTGKGSGLAFMNAPSGSLIAYATSPGNTASDGTGTNGLYTSALLQHLNTPNTTIEEVFKLVRQTVIKESGGKQTPWESTSLLGKFYFTK